MSTESELYTFAFWKSAIARAVSVAAVAASSLLINVEASNIRDAPWYGVVSTAAMTGLIILLGLIGGAGIRNAVPGDVTTRQALAALSPTGRHAKPETDEPGA